MKKNSLIIEFMIPSLIFLSLSACFSTQAVSTTQVESISSPSTTFTYTPKPTNTIIVTNTPSPISTNTPLPTPTNTPSPTMTPLITLNEFSPEDIARVIREKSLNDLWKIWRGPQKRSFVQFISTYNNFSVQRLYIETKNPEVEYAILSIGEQDYKRTWLYMLFKREGSIWQVFDYIELHSKYLIEPSYQIIDVDGHDIWLVVRWLANSGTGFALYEQNWYRLNSEKLEVALRYPVNGHEEYGMGIPPAHVEFKGELVEYRPDPQTDDYSVEIIFDASYVSSFVDHNKEELPEYYPIFSIKRKAHYLWNEKQQIFLLDSKNSEVNQYEIDKLFHYNATEFVQYTYDELLELATIGNKYQKKWLELMLEQAEESPAKENLLKQLKR